MPRAITLIPVLALLLASSAVAGAAGATGSFRVPAAAAAAPAPLAGASSPLELDVWTARGEAAVYTRGEMLTLYFRAGDDCYVAIYEIDTDGHVRLLFPRYPDDGFVYGGMTYRLPEYYDRATLTAEGPRGVAYIHAVASRDPRAFALPVSRGAYALGAEPVTDDPFVAMNAIDGSIAREQWIDATATASYFIESRVWYPRYMCGGCHRGHGFDPYTAVCPRYSVSLGFEDDYWWACDYHPARVRFVFAGPFWRFTLRSTRHYHYPHLSCAWGFGNYHPLHPPRRPWTEHPIVLPHTTRYREYEHAYRPQRYDGHARHDKPTRSAGATRERSAGATRERSAGVDRGREAATPPPANVDRDRSAGATRERSAGVDRSREAATPPPANVDRDRGAGARPQERARSDERARPSPSSTSSPQTRDSRDSRRSR